MYISLCKMIQALKTISQSCNGDKKNKGKNQTKNLQNYEFVVQYKCKSEPISYTYMSQKSVMKDWFCHNGIWLNSSFFILFNY